MNIWVLSLNTRLEITVRNLKWGEDVFPWTRRSHPPHVHSPHVHVHSGLCTELWAWVHSQFVRVSTRWPALRIGPSRWLLVSWMKMCDVPLLLTPWYLVTGGYVSLSLRSSQGVESTHEKEFVSWFRVRSLFPTWTRIGLLSYPFILKNCSDLIPISRLDTKIRSHISLGIS